MTDTSGRTSRTPFAFYDPESQCLRMSQGTFGGDSTPSSPTLPPSGSMCSGALFAHRRSALPTDANACSSSPLLKTPTAQLAVNGGSQHPDKRKAGGHGPTLADEVEHLLPTPAARDWRSGESNIMNRNARPLNEVVVNLLPTPTATPYGNNQSASPGAAVRPSLNSLAPLLPTPRASDGTNGGPNQRGSKGDLALPAAVVQLLPTPTARLGDSTSRGADPARYKGPKSMNGRRSNLDDCVAAVETNAPWLGGSSNRPSAAGSTPPDDPPPGQLMFGID